MDPFSRDEIEGRWERARQAMTQHGLEALLVVGRSFYDRPGSLAYLSGHLPPFPTGAFVGEVRGLGHAALVLPREGDPALVVDSAHWRRDRVAVSDVRPSLDEPHAVATVLDEKGLGKARLGLVGEDLLPVAFFRALTTELPGLRVKSADALIAGMRTIKSAAEMEAMRRAAQVADAALEAALAQVQPGASERHICGAGIAAAMEAGADFVRYLRVHTGAWSAWSSRWPPATERVVADGDLVTLDVIGARDAYQFDVLRSTVAGQPSDEQQQMLDAALAATEAAVAAVRPGAACAEVVRVAQESIDRAGFGQHAARFIGHGIGLETMEEPYLLPGAAGELREGMVLCIEPGIYVPERWGCCFEQEVIVTGSGCEVITSTPLRRW